MGLACLLTWRVLQYGWTPLLRATAQGSAALVDLLANTEGVDLEAAPPDGVRSTALHMVAVAAGGGGDDAAVALAETLLKAGAKADSRDAAGRTPLHRAARNGAVAVAAALVAAGANVNALSTEVRPRSFQSSPCLVSF